MPQKFAHCSGARSNLDYTLGQLQAIQVPMCGTIFYSPFKKPSMNENLLQSWYLAQQVTPRYTGRHVHTLYLLSERSDANEAPLKT